jgi:hypothetical protein
MSESNIEESLALANRLVAYLREQVNRKTITVSDLARDTNTPPHEVLGRFAHHGIQVGSYSEPSLYRVADIMESLTRTEVGNRYNRAS